MKNPPRARISLVTSLRPISDDPAAAVALARESVRSRREPEAEAVPFLSAVESDITAGVARGVLRIVDGRPVGLALWSAPTSIGLTVEVLHLEEALQTPSAYREFVREIESSAGPIAFAPGRLAGLSPEEESGLMDALGFALFARSEMRLPADAPSPASVDVAGLRPLAPEDEPGLRRVYRRAYDGRIDRFLFQIDPDPEKDAVAAIREILDGRWGECLPWASFVVPGPEGVVAATLVTRAPYGPLIAHVMVDPSHQRRGLGRAVLSATILALRAHHEPVIVLNVTEGNARAIRLYEGLGFVRTLGPSHGWFARSRIPLRAAER
jgi:ribosomal protein S18 acetylase RimI-like enzyme